MKKKLIALLLAMSLVLSLAACGSKEETAPETEEPQVEEPAAPDTEEETEAPETEGETEETETPEEETETPEVKPEAEKPEAKPEAQKPAEKPAAKPEAQKPAEKPAAKPEAQKPAEKPASKSVDLTAFYGQLEQLMVKTLGEENAPSMMPMDDDMKAAFYPGLAELNPKQSVIAGPMISAVVAEFALVEANNAEDAAKVAEIFNARIANQVGTDGNPGAAWYPESIESWKNHSKVVTNGNYVMMVAIEGNQTYIDAFNALFA